MKYIKTIVTLIERAEKKGTAKINTREKDWYTGWTGDIIEKYRVDIKEGKAILYHYGTHTATVNTVDNELEYYYGESVSDRDSLNTFVDYFSIEPNFRYFPSTETFIYEDQKGREIMESTKEVLLSTLILITTPIWIVPFTLYEMFKAQQLK